VNTAAHSGSANVEKNSAMAITSISWMTIRYTATSMRGSVAGASQLCLNASVSIHDM
jgi:hypothetical protein